MKPRQLYVYKTYLRAVHTSVNHILLIILIRTLINASKKTIIFALLAAVVASMIFVALGATDASAQVSNMSSSKTSAPSISQSTVVLPPQAVIELEGKTIPANDFIPLYDTTPYMIKSGHIEAKLPCDASSTSPLKILVGQDGGYLTSANLTLIKPLSTPGKMCFYQADLVSQPYTHGDWLCITDIVIRNPTSTTMTFPPTTSVDIGAEQIASGAGMTAGTSMTTTK